MTTLKPAIRPWVANAIRLCVHLVGASILFAQFLTVRAPAQTQSTPSETPSNDEVIVLLPPVVDTEVVSYGSHAQAAGNFSFESELSDAAKDHLGTKSRPLRVPGDLADSAAVSLIEQLEPFTSRLARGAVNDEAHAVLARLAELSPHYVIVVEFMQIKQGPGASWNSMTGAITSSMSSTLVQAALISTRNGRIAWKNEAFERKVFRPGDPRFEKVLAQLYSTLGNGGGSL